MKICRFNHDRIGIVCADEVADVSPALDAIPALHWPVATGDVLIRHWSLIAPGIEALLPTAPRLALTELDLLSPITNPSKIIGIARNRRNLASEKIDIGGGSSDQRQDGDPIQMFIKAPSAIAGPSEGVIPRFADRRTDPEAELTIIIGKAGSQISEHDAFQHIFGYCIGLDMTLRGKESPSSRKSIDHYAVLGPWIVTADEVPNPDALDMRFELNGHLIQEANTRDLAFGIAEIVAHASQFYTLHPGDAIMVGTPVGFEPVKPGDMMRAEFSSIGAMNVRVHDYA
jgi:2-keto-4-pentenoate hydratase/2-oxohepta-3-ene-1,7-dioic acid hydratase in catechol pathway